MMGRDGVFEFVPLFNKEEESPFSGITADLEGVAPDPLGPLGALRGVWKGTGFNTIWRPLHDPDHPEQSHFLELNLTVESIEFTEIQGDIPNRGLLQGDLFMNGLHYMQLVSDNHGHGLHLEPGVWLIVPPTTDPQVPQTVVRMGSIPHGTTILAQGLVSSESRAPNFENINIKPFPVGRPDQPIDFPEANLSIPTDFRSQPPLIDGITQAMVDAPNSVLESALVGQTITQTTNLIITTAQTPVIGGGTANTAFLQGDRAPNAVAARMDSIFWIEEVEEAGATVLQLQYTQTVTLDFAGLSWPHVSVATLRKVPAAA
jgi:hypothetical protein